MAEISIPWGDIAPGDAGPYGDGRWSDVWRDLRSNNPATQGVLDTFLGELAVTGGASPISVASGAGLVDGKYYHSSTTEQIIIPTPSVGTRIDRVVLRKSWSAQTVRLTRIAGEEGGTAPALVQVSGTTWDVPLAEVTITTGGTITVVDERSNLVTNLRAGGVNRPATALTIDGGDILASRFAHGLIPESSTSDDLENIFGLRDGDFGVLFVDNPTTDVITIKNGVGNIECFGGADIELQDGGVLYYARGGTVLVAGGGGGGQEVLTANRTYYVRTDGDDSNDGRTNSAGGAFLTIQHAVDVISKLNIAGFNITVQVADGTYTTPIVLKNVTGFSQPGALVIQGNNSTPANVVLHTTGTSVITANALDSVWDIKDLKVQTTTSGSAIACFNGAAVRFSNLDFGTLGSSSAHIQCYYDAKVYAIGNYTISGNANYHVWCNFGSLANISSRTITILNSPVFTTFCLAFGLGKIVMLGNTFVNRDTVTAKRADTQMNSITFINATESTYLPGNTAGTTATGGQYG